MIKKRTTLNIGFVCLLFPLACTTERQGMTAIPEVPASTPYSQPTQAQPEIIRDATRSIVFASDRDGDSEIYIMNDDGSALLQLTDNSTADRSPKWSPDGAKIAFWSERDGNPEVYVMNADGSNQFRLTHNTIRDALPTWHWNNEYVVYTSLSDQAYYIRIDGSEPELLFPDIYGVYDVSWSPNTELIIFTAFSSQSFEIFIKPNSANAKLSNLSNDPGNDQNPSWSPDGQRILFDSDREGNKDIYILNIDGTGLINLTNHRAEDINPAWSEDGTRIIFHSNRDGNFDVFTMKRDGSDVDNLTQNPANDSSPDWLPVSNALAVTNRGINLYQQGDAATATAYFQQALELDPDLGKAWHWLGNLRQDQGDYQDSISKYSQAIGLYSEAYDKAVVYLERGYSQKLSGNEEEAIADYTKAIELDSNFLRAYIYRGEVYEALGEAAKAISDYKSALTISEDSELNSKLEQRIQELQNKINP